MNSLQFEVSIDELDISKVKAGQAVNITADALEDSSANPLTGKVTKVAMEGTSSNGVTTYPVTVTVDQASVSKLKTGMNIDAEIVMSKKTDVLMVPLDAITKMGTRSFVYVKQSGSQSDSTQNGWSGNSEQRNWQRGENTNGSGFGRGRNTSGSAMNGDFPQGNPPQGDFQPGQNGGSTSGGAMGMRSRNTSGSAISGSFARAARNRSSSQNDYYSGAMLVPVETGISNDSYIEITSGLTEGQTIILPKSSTASGSTGFNSWGRNRENGGSSNSGGNSSRASGMMGGGGDMGGGPGGGF
jgi:HlyD family secretion protein